VAGKKSPNKMVVLLGLAPWLLYGVASGRSDWGVATGGGVVLCSIWLFALSRSTTIKLMDGTALAFFAAASVIMIGLRSTAFPVYHVVVIWSFFAAAAWASVVLRMPFTEAYAREEAPREFWDNPAFRRFNWIMTLVWCALFSVNVGFAALGVRISGNFGRLVPGFLIPTGLLILGFAFSKRFPNYYFAGLQPAPAAPKAASGG
jgi:hypothetical protein